MRAGGQRSRLLRQSRREAAETPGETMAVRAETRGSRHDLVIRRTGDDMKDKLALESMA